MVVDQPFLVAFKGELPACPLVLQRVDGGGHAASAVGEDGAGVRVHGHDRRIAQKAAEVQLVANLLADGGDDAHGGGLVVDHADGALVGDDAEDGLDRRVAGDGDHVKSHAAHARHGLKLLQAQCAGLGRANHASILGHGDERAGQAADTRRCHDAALLHRVVEHGQRRRGARAAALTHADGFQDFGHRVALGRGGGQRQVQNALRHAHAAAGLAGHQLAGAGDLERGGLDGLGNLGHVGVLRHIRQHLAYHAGAGNAHVDDSVGLARTVERAGHERVVLHGVAEHHQLACADAVAVRA